MLKKLRKAWWSNDKGESCLTALKPHKYCVFKVLTIKKRCDIIPSQPSERRCEK